MRHPPTQVLWLLHVDLRAFGSLRGCWRMSSGFRWVDHDLQLHSGVAAPQDKRLHPRLAKRIKVRYRSGEAEKWRSAFSQDVSTTGVYIHATTVPTTPVIQLEITDEEKTILLEGTVVRGKKVPPRLRRMIKSGFAVKLQNIPDSWYSYCLDLEEKARERGQRFLVATTEVSR